MARALVGPGLSPQLNDGRVVEGVHQLGQLLQDFEEAHEEEQVKVAKLRGGERG